MVNWNIKKDLEQSNSNIREAVYLGIAIGFYDAFLAKHNEIDSIKQLSLLSKVEKDKFLNVIVELTIVDLPLLESMFNKVEEIKLKVNDKTINRPSFAGVHDALGIKDLFTPDLLETAKNHNLEFSSAIINSRLAYENICGDKKDD